MSEILLTDAVLRSLSIARVFRDFARPANSMSFTPDGKYLACASDGDVLGIYDCEPGVKAKQYNAKKYGVSHVNFFHSGIQSCVCSSRCDFDFALRYWDLFENAYVRYFAGHTDAVTMVDVHPYEDALMSGSRDRTTLLWDLRKENPVARISGSSASYGSFDMQGLTFSVTCAENKVALFDWKKYDQGEFAAFDVSPFVDPGSGQTVTKCLFSPCGRYLVTALELPAERSGKIIAIDAFSGQLIGIFAYEGLVPSSFSVSPDSQFIAAGSTTGNIVLWRVPLDRLGDSSSVSRKLEYPLEQPCCVLSGHTAGVSHVAFNPSRCLLSSATVNVAFWLPSQ